MHTVKFHLNKQNRITVYTVAGIMILMWMLILSGIWFTPQIPFSPELTHRLAAWHNVLWN